MKRMKVWLWVGAVFVVVVAGAAVTYLVRVYSEPYMPPRPANIPQFATYVAGPKGRGNWTWCSVGDERQANICHICNVQGEVLYEGVFLRYEGTGVVPRQNLKISQRSGPQWIELDDGTILIPGSDYPQIKRFLDWLKHKRASP